MKQHLLALLAITSSSGLSAAAHAESADGVELKDVHAAEASSNRVYKAASLVYISLQRMQNGFGETVIVDPSSTLHDSPFGVRVVSLQSEQTAKYARVLDIIKSLHAGLGLRAMMAISNILKKNPASTVVCQRDEKNRITSVDELPFNPAACEAYTAEHLEQNPPITSFNRDRIGNWHALWGAIIVKKMTLSSNFLPTLYNAWLKEIEKKYMLKSIMPGRDPIDGAAIALRITRRTAGLFNPAPINMASVDAYPFAVTTISCLPTELPTKKISLSGLRESLPLDPKAIESIIADLATQPTNSIVIYLDSEGKLLGQATYDAPPKDKEIKSNLTKFPIISVKNQPRLTEYSPGEHYCSLEAVTCGNQRLGCIYSYFPPSPFASKSYIDEMYYKYAKRDLRAQIAEQEQRS